MPNNPTKDATEFYGAAAHARTNSSGAPNQAKPVNDYSDQDVAKLPANIAALSFGCGNPLAFADVRAGDVVLDLGCGAGLDLLLAAEKVGHGGRVIGLDASPDMLRFARKNVERTTFRERIELTEGTIEAIPLPNWSVNHVISNCVVNLSPDKTRVFQEIARVLKPGGHVLIADLVVEGLPEWATMHADLYSACIAGAVSQKDYVRLAARVGLSDVRIVDRLQYDAGMVRALLGDELPLAIDEIAQRLGMSRNNFLDMAGEALAGCVTNIKLTATRPA